MLSELRNTGFCHHGPNLGENQALALVEAQNTAATVTIVVTAAAVVAAVAAAVAGVGATPLFHQR